MPHHTFWQDGGYVLNNGVVRVVINSAGHISSLVDAATGLESIAPGEVGNRLQLHRDIPNQWDAWDVDEHYRRTVHELDSVDEMRLESKPEEAAVVVARSFGGSRIEQRLALAAGSPSVEITNTIDWHEKQKLLKLGFALDVHADRSAAEIQIRARLPAHPHQHVMGVRPIRNLRPTIPTCRRAGLRGSGDQRLDVRPRRRPAQPGRRRDHHAGPPVVAAGPPVPRSAC
jgi:Glycosyl hydrolases family 38 C-terminal domain